MAITSLHDLAPSNDPGHVLAKSADGATAFPVSVRPIPASGSIAQDFHATPRIFVAHAGVGRRSYKRGLRTLDLRTAPRMVEVYEAGLVFERASWDGQGGRCVEIEFRGADVEALTHGDMHALMLRTQHEVFDERINSLAMQLATEVLAEMPSGPLYAHGLCVALLGVLSANYAGIVASPVVASRGLTPDHKRRVADLVAAEFGGKLTLERLSAEVRLSPHHFSRLFKSSFGMTPHEYVQGVRLDAAVRALCREGERPISEIADACGFASQSHMTELMRRSLGVTPRVLRRGDRKTSVRAD